MGQNNSSGAKRAGRRDFWVLLGCLLLVFGVLFHKSLLPQYVVHNNDTPLGAMMQAYNDLPEGFTGTWVDSNWPGGAYFMLLPYPTQIFRWWFGNLAFAKFWAALAQVILGLCAWGFFRSLKFSPATCVLGGLAAALHSDFFSNSCWGQQSRPMALAMMFLALAAVQSRSGWRGWVRVLLAGAAVGTGVMEGFDIAALFSVVVGIYVLVQPWVEAEGSPAEKISKGFVRAVLLAGFAGVVAAQQVTGLVGTQIKGVAGMQADEGKSGERWNWATQWSLPKVETLGLIVPGLFGYRMDTPLSLPEELQQSYAGGSYWGSMGRDASWEEYLAAGKQGAPPRGFLRHSGGGSYAGPLLMAVVLWGFLQSLRGKLSPFNESQKRWVWFWAAAAGVAMLLAWGKHAPFYKLFYALPYVSTIRSPAKFIHIWDWSMLVLFGYGVHALSKTFWERRISPAGAAANWWATAPGFDRKWVVGSALAVGAAVLAWMIYASSSTTLQRYLQEVQFDPDMARNIAKFSVSRVGWFVLYLVLGLGVLALVVTGKLAGQRAKLGAILLGTVLVVDLAHANRPWIIYWDWKLKYASSDLIERVRQRPYEQRIVGMPDWIMSSFQFNEKVVGEQQLLDQLYRVEWAQQQFQYYNIQSLDVVQMPRAPQDYVAYETALGVRSTETLPLLTRKWELTNTRYLLALAPFVDFFNRQFDPGKGRFRVAERFDIAPKPGVVQARSYEELTAVTNSQGKYALIEFTGALPRAKLYSDWQVSTNDEATLKKLADLSFDPAQQVLVADPIAPPVTTATNPSPGTVEFVSYTPKRITLQARTESPAVLLFNDHFSPDWAVQVDGRSERVLRCNYIMRGVQLAPGEHKVEFIFSPNLKAFYLTMTGLGLTVLLGLGLLLVRKRSETAPTART